MNTARKIRSTSTISLYLFLLLHKNIATADIIHRRINRITKTITVTLLFPFEGVVVDCRTTGDLVADPVDESVAGLG